MFFPYWFSVVMIEFEKKKMNLAFSHWFLINDFDFDFITQQPIIFISIHNHTWDEWNCQKRIFSCLKIGKTFIIIMRRAWKKWRFLCELCNSFLSSEIQSHIDFCYAIFRSIGISEVSRHSQTAGSVHCVLFTSSSSSPFRFPTNMLPLRIQWN